jgi:hypothetical protein
MAERDQMLIALVQEVLGPRYGQNEILPEEQDPRTEYITGVLEPASASTIEDRPEDTVDEIIEETSSEEDQDTQGYVATPGVFSPALDPKALPRSIGISFTLESESLPRIEVCATWARYYQELDGWHRTPDGFLSGVLDASQATIEREAASGVRLHIRSRQLITGTWRVSVFLVNVTQIAGERPVTSEYLFQPQLRIHVCDGTRLVPVRHLDESNLGAERTSVEHQEEISLALLYRQRTAFARGHMAGAIWHDIDAERPFDSVPRPQNAPFIWTDSNVISEPERNKFIAPHIRTDLTPVYLVQTPEMGWLAQYGSAPELNPANLSELWEPDQIRLALQPLVDGYLAWLADQQSQVAQLGMIYQETAARHLEECNRVVNRVQEAIDILATDDDARLAFCFANKAIDVQSRWKSPDHPLSWRPFQIAFILLNIPALANPLHSDREICDLLWFPTGGGKTEAYLGLSAFVLGLRRLRAKQNQHGENRTGAGVGVLSRYTLRLLTIQQFRRALGVITACEQLRVMMNAGGTGMAGWRPQACKRADNFLWGGLRFSAGLWVGGGVTPNSLLSIHPFPLPNGQFMMFAGAIDILRGLKPDYRGADQELLKYASQVRGSNMQAEGEPAQVTQCPCCQSTLSVPNDGLGAGQHFLHFVYSGGNVTIPPISLLNPRTPLPSLVINSINMVHHSDSTFHTLSVNFNVPERSRLTDENVDEWWENYIKPALGNNVELQSARPARPGYFIVKYPTNRNAKKQCDFDIYCPNPECELNQSLWAEQVPEPRDREGARTNVRQAMLGQPRSTQIPEPAVVLTDGLLWQDVPEPFRLAERKKWSTRIPIPAFTVDDQIYHRCPSLVIATVDKFARLAYEPKAASLFGNVTHYHSRWGYYREGCPPSDGSQSQNYREHPAGIATGNPLHRSVMPFSPPDLILQDELHLIEGPLGSMVGLYETAIDLLAQKTVDDHPIIPKYIASTATVRKAEAQIQSLFNRQLMQFPPSALSSDERFFATGGESHALDNSKSGRLYVAVCAPGKGAQTPIVRIWSSLLQGAYELSQSSQPENIDPFWTLVGYFNATRELAGALSLYRQDIPERIDSRVGCNARDLDDSRRMELSSRASSTNLPILLQKLEIPCPTAQDSVFATSMFGTGVDVDRLSLMVVHGQPKTTSSYIQATGRVGRKSCGLVVSFFRASRPRDLDHYEFFTGYHRALYRYVEPVTVAPFSPRARERALGPLSVILLRQAQRLNDVSVNNLWRIQQRIGSTFYSLAGRMSTARFDQDVMVIPGLFETRAQSQPDGRRPLAGVTESEASSELDRWRALAAQNPDQNLFVYNEPALLREPQRHVVLGDSQHHMRFDEAFENAPQSLRDVEETTGFKV